jgi:hypothetical protein
VGSDVRTVLIDGKVVFHEGRHAWVDREAVVAELREVARRQQGDPRRREMRELAEQIARAFDSYPRQIFDPLTR